MFCIFLICVFFNTKILPHKKKKKHKKKQNQVIVLVVALRDYYLVQSCNFNLDSAERSVSFVGDITKQIALEE